jgi:uncharacterized protein
MTKYLLLIVLSSVVWWLWRKSRARDSVAPPPPVRKDAENMVKCAYCGVNQPISETLQAGERFYCCAAHRRAAETEGADPP